MKHFLGLVLIGLVVIGMGWVWAAENSELEKRAIAQREADERHAREEAARVEREQADRRHREELEQEARHKSLHALELMREKLLSQLGDNHPRVQEVQQKIAILKEDIERRTHHVKPNPREKMAEKIEHLHAAAEHLHQAGMPDLARELHERAEVMERELHRHHGEHEADHRLGEVMEVVQDLRREMEKLRDEVAEMREQLQKEKR